MKSTLSRVLSVLMLLALSSGSALAAAGLSCEHMDPFDYLCEATPQGEGYTYTWSVQGTMTFPYPSGNDNPFKTAVCTPGHWGWLRVEVAIPGQGTETSGWYHLCSAG